MPFYPKPASAEPDRRLDRLFDYTKFHIGIYLTIAGAAVTLLSAAAKQDSDSENTITSLIGDPLMLLAGALCVVLAGAAGGIIASSATQYESFDKLYKDRLGPDKLRLFTGRYWILIEHQAFWLGLLLIACSLLKHKGVLTLIVKMFT
jgi:hypothetical protein